MVILTGILIASLLFLKNKMDGLMILGCYMASNILIEFTGIIININLKLTESPDEAVSLWTQKIASIGAKPIIVIWIVYMIFSKKHPFAKVTIATLLLFSLLTFELLFIKVGFLEFVKWNTFYEFLRYVGIIIVTLIYAKTL